MRLATVGLKHSGTQEGSLYRAKDDPQLENRSKLLACIYVFVRLWNEPNHPVLANLLAGFHTNISLLVGIVNQLDKGNPMDERSDEAFGGSAPTSWT